MCEARRKGRDALEKLYWAQTVLVFVVLSCTWCRGVMLRVMCASRQLSLFPRFYLRQEGTRSSSLNWPLILSMNGLSTALRARRAPPELGVAKLGVGRRSPPSIAISLSNCLEHRDGGATTPARPAWHVARLAACAAPGVAITPSRAHAGLVALATAAGAGLC